VENWSAAAGELLARCYACCDLVRFCFLLEPFVLLLLKMLLGAAAAGCLHSTVVIGERGYVSSEQRGESVGGSFRNKTRAMRSIAV